MLHLLLLVAFLAIFPTQTIQSDLPDVLVSSICGRKNYTKNSPYSVNLNTLLTSILTNSSSTPFFQTSVGLPPSNDTVFGRYYCRHDISLPACSECITSATKQLLSDCPNKTEAITYFEHCTLVILNSTAKLEAVDTTAWATTYVKTNVTDPAVFLPVLKATTDVLINRTAYGSGFDTEEAEKVPPFGKTLYTLAQCTPDRLGNLCERCLRRSLEEAEASLGTPVGVAYFYPNCQIRYSYSDEIYDIPPSANSPPPPPPPRMLGSPPPPPPPRMLGSPPPPGKNWATASLSNNVLNLGIFLALSAIMFGN